jgi:hypothetical protein
MADSYKQNGPFSKQSSTLLAAIISIEPSSAVDVAPGKLELCFAINDEFGSDSEEQCQSVTNNAAVVYAPDTSIDAASHYHAGCSMLYSNTDGCFCCTFATHFSVYTVSDVAATDASQDQLLINAQEILASVDTDRGTNAASEISEIEIDNEHADSGLGVEVDNTTSGGGMGGAIGGTVAGLLLVALAALVVIHKKRKDARTRAHSRMMKFEPATTRKNPLGRSNNNIVRESTNHMFAHRVPVDGAGALGGDLQLKRHHFDDNGGDDIVEKDRTKSVQEAVDPSTGATYYHNTVTDKTAWTANEASRRFVKKDAAPQDLRTERTLRTESVQAVADPGSGKTYFHNTITDKTAWTAEEASRQSEQKSASSEASRSPQDMARLEELNAATQEHEAKKKKHLRKSMAGYGRGARNSIMARTRASLAGRGRYAVEKVVRGQEV